MKIGELSDIVKQSGVPSDLVEEFLKACIIDIFRIDLRIIDEDNPKKLFFRVDLASDTQHIDDFVARHSLSDKREKLLGRRDYIFQNCKEIIFQGSYMTTFRGATDSVVVWDYHEYRNQGVDIRERLIDNLNKLITGFLVGMSAGMTGAYVPTFPEISSNTFYNIITQGLIWGTITALGLHYFNKIRKSITKRSRTVSLRERLDKLGYETIVNDQISLDAIEKSLGGNYEEFKPPRESHFVDFEETEGRYGGRASLYKVEAKRPSISFWRKNKSTLSLYKRLQDYPSRALFGLVLADTHPSNIIGSAILYIKIGKEMVILHKIKGFLYNPSKQSNKSGITEYKIGEYLITSKSQSPPLL